VFVVWLKQVPPNEGANLLTSLMVLSGKGRPACATFGKNGQRSRNDPGTVRPGKVLSENAPEEVWINGPVLSAVQANTKHELIPILPSPEDWASFLNG
jgi:hypothetical protein